MDDPQYPATHPVCDWERFCRELPHMLHQMEEVAASQAAIGKRLRSMDERDELMAANIAALAQNQLSMHSQLEIQRRQTANIVEGLRMFGTTASGFAALGGQVEASVSLTKRVLRFFLRKVLVPLGAGATAFLALWGAFHIAQSKSEPVDDAQQTQAPRGDE